MKPTWNRNFWSKQLYKTEEGTPVVTPGSSHASINVAIQISYVRILSHVFQGLTDCPIRPEDVLDQDETCKTDCPVIAAGVPAPCFEPCHLSAVRPGLQTDRTSDFSSSECQHSSSQECMWTTTEITETLTCPHTATSPSNEQDHLRFIERGTSQQEKSSVLNAASTAVLSACLRKELQQAARQQWKFNLCHPQVSSFVWKIKRHFNTKGMSECAWEGAFPALRLFYCY